MRQKDTYRARGMRRQLMKIIEAKGIKDKAVLDAVGKVPRHLFLDNAFLERAYKDEAFPIGEGQTISQPFTVAYQTVLLEVRKGMKVLEVGTGSGYQACILSELGARVFSIERQRKLYEKTKALLEEIGYGRIKVFFGDGNEGLPAFAPFDRIIITAAGNEIPEKLKSQLASGGILVMPLGGQELQKMIRLKKTGENRFEVAQHDHFKFVPLLRGKAW